MVGKVLKYGLLVLVVLVAYRYFFGSNEEKAQSRELIGSAKLAAEDLREFIGLRKEDITSDDYEETLEELREIYKDIEDKTDSEAVKDSLDQYDERAERLLEEVEDKETSGLDSLNIQERVERLLEQSKYFLEKLKNE